MKLVIPMAGEGLRFLENGYKLPKPLIDVNGVPMIELVINNFDSSYIDEYVFIYKKKHEEEFEISRKLKNICKKPFVVFLTDKVTEGAASTILYSKKIINTSEEILIANSDQFVDFNSIDFLNFCKNDLDGAILTFKSKNKKYSYAKTNKKNEVIEVAEKVTISNYATVGIYYWKKGSDFVTCANKMIEKNIRTNGEFYVCPVFNEAIEKNLKIKTYLIKSEKMWCLGTPEDLNYFLKNKK